MGGCLTNLEDKMFNVNFHDNDSTNNHMIVYKFWHGRKFGTEYGDPEPQGAPVLGTQDPWAQSVHCNSISKAFISNSLQFAFLARYGEKMGTTPDTCHDGNDLWEVWNYLLWRSESPGIQSQYETFVLCRADIHKSSFRF